MKEIYSNIPDIMSKMKWGPRDLIRRGMSNGTAYRVSRGDTSISLRTLALACGILQIPLEAAVVLRDNEEDNGLRERQLPEE